MKSPKSVIKNVFIFLFVILFLFLLISPCFGVSGNLGINLDLFHVSIHNPRGIIYTFGSGESPIMNLSVSSDRNATFKYTLRDVINNLIIYSNVVFIPNTTFTAVSGLNEIIVYANDSAGNIKNSSVNFFVISSNSPPVINGINSTIYTCEGSYLSYFFNVTDADGSSITPNINPTSPTSPFYVVLRSHYNSQISIHEIFSGILSKSDAGSTNRSKTYLENISVSDGNYSDSDLANITVIGINNAPVMENISNQSFIVGETFYKQLIVNDTEDGNPLNGNLSFNVSFQNSTLFNISSTGAINLIINSSHIGNHNITVCAIDKGITPHVNISLCGQTGSNLSACRNFILNITSCGDSVCNNGETCSSCSGDCGACSSGTSGGGGGGGSSIEKIINFSIDDVTIKPDLVTLNIKKGDVARQILDIKNNKQQSAILGFSLDNNLKGINIVSARNLTLKPNEQRSFDLDFFCNESTPVGVYTGKILITYRNFTKEISLLINVNDKESLFDIMLYADKKKITSGNELSFHLRLYNLGKFGAVNASVEYFIKDFEGKIISRDEKNISLDTNLTLSDKFTIPKNLEVGRYALGVNFKYGNLSAVSSDSFEVVSNKIYFYTVLLFSIAIFLIIIIIIYIKIRNYYRKKTLKSLRHKQH